MEQFYTGTCDVPWLRHHGPWFISIRRFQRIKPRSYPWSVGKWALDSGAFTEISTYGKWTVGYRGYANRVLVIRERVGSMDWCAPQDYMCEPFIIQKTGLSVARHQELTVHNFLDLRGILGTIVIPVVQGWNPWEYLEHVELYSRYGVDLRKEAIVGVGSICRRQHTSQASQILTLLKSEGLNLHAFGMKLQGLKANCRIIKSADSAAWSFDAWRSDRRGTLNHRHVNPAHCIVCAKNWKRKVMPYVERKEKAYVPRYGYAPN